MNFIINAINRTRNSRSFHELSYHSFHASKQPFIGLPILQTWNNELDNEIILVLSQFEYGFCDQYEPLMSEYTAWAKY